MRLMNIFEKYPNSTFLKGLPDDSDFFPLRERIVELFSFLDGLEDQHFEQQLDQDAQARLWEMMLAKILKSEGYELKSTDHGPDFVIETDGKRVFIEAVCPGPGDEGNPNSVPPIVYGAPIAQDVPVPQIVLRIRSALEGKKQKYKHYVEQGIVSVSDCCVIAVSSSKLSPRAKLWPPTIMRATHGLGNPYVIFGKDEGAVGEGIESCESIPKVNGQDIDTRFFLSEENALISAVLYSDCSFFSLVFDLFDESMILHNPKAFVLLPQGFIKRIKEIWTICCQNGSEWRAYRIKDAQQTAGGNSENAAPQP
ncbi:hypothetical protein [Candidatus Methylomirabilis sp.]|jgi:hypothetical protein|uniref:hypothetical protein n=1 Tax=Candidatus Methylomirabilis sp. TaxID=2032687 RepID=UPI003C77353A